MLDNCFRFAPRDSIPGLIAKICKYLKDHPGWSEAELEEQIKKFISAAGVESFNGRTGTVTLDKNDVNTLKIASAYFAEGDESIDSLDLVSLYNQGVRFVFTDFNSVTSGYNLAFVLDYFSGSGDVVYYPMSTGSGGGGNIVSVNGKTGVVQLSLSDIVGTSGVQVKLCTAEELASTNTVTWNAYYNEGYRIVGVVNASSTAIDSIYLLKQDENNHTPIGLSTGTSDAYTPSNPPPYPVTSVNGKTGAVVGLYSVENPPPYPVTSVNGKTGVVTGLYDAENQPPYPVTSVNGKTGVVTGLYDEENQPPYPVTSVNGKNGAITGLYGEDSPPPYPVTSVDGLTGAVTIPSFIKTVYAPINTDNQQYNITVPAKSLVKLINVLAPFEMDSTTLPSGNEDGITLVKTGGGITVADMVVGLRLPGYNSWYTGFIDNSTCTVVYKNTGSHDISLRYGVSLQLINPYSEDFIVTVKGYY